MLTDGDRIQTLEEHLAASDEQEDQDCARPGMTPTNDERLRNATARLIRAEVERQEVEREIVYRVHRLRELGASWATIGQALGVTKQSAAKRFGS